MGSIVKWAKFGSWSGPYIRGVCKYVPPSNPTGFDVIVAAVAKPEGGAWDTFVAYDGTAVTYGLLQWTFTSGRLHKLLVATAKAMVTTAHSASYWYPFGDGLKKIDLWDISVVPLGPDVVPMKAPEQQENGPTPPPIPEVPDDPEPDMIPEG